MRAYSLIFGYAAAILILIPFPGKALIISFSGGFHVLDVLKETSGRLPSAGKKPLRHVGRAATMNPRPSTGEVAVGVVKGNYTPIHIA